MIGSKSNMPPAPKYQGAVPPAVGLAEMAVHQNMGAICLASSNQPASRWTSEAEKAQSSSSRIRRARDRGVRQAILVAVNALTFGGGGEVTDAAPLTIACERARLARRRRPSSSKSRPPSLTVGTGRFKQLPAYAGGSSGMTILKVSHPPIRPASVWMG